MIYRCFVCSKIKVKKSDTYQIQIRGDGPIITKLICDKCGDKVNEVYDQNKSLADQEFKDE